MSLKRVVYGLLFLVTVVAYNNCSSQFSLLESIQTSTASSQCRQAIVAKAASIPVDFNLCENPANYSCDIRHFRKGVGSVSSKAQQCANIAGMGEACVPVNIFNYDMTSQQETAAADELVEGGSYNRDEVSCINTKVKTRDIATIQEEGNTLAETLERTIEVCRQRSRQ